MITIALNTVLCVLLLFHVEVWLAMLRFSINLEYLCKYIIIHNIHNIYVSYVIFMLFFSDGQGIEDIRYFSCGSENIGEVRNHTWIGIIS